MNFLQQLGFEPVWFQIKYTNILLQEDKENSMFYSLPSDDGLNNIYLKLFYWTDHQKVTDNDVSEIKDYFKYNLDLDYHPKIRVKTPIGLGYPVWFDIIKDQTEQTLYITPSGYIKQINRPIMPIFESNNNDLYCLRYTQYYNDFQFWKHRSGITELDESSVTLQYNLPSRHSGNNDNDLNLLHFISSNKIPKKLIEFWDDKSFTSWDVIKKTFEKGTVQKKELVMKDFIKGFYKNNHYTETWNMFQDAYLEECLDIFKTKVSYNLDMTIEEFINSEYGKSCKQDVPNKEVGHIYNLDITDFLI